MVYELVRECCTLRNFQSFSLFGDRFIEGENQYPVPRHRWNQRRSSYSVPLTHAGGIAMSIVKSLLLAGIVLASLASQVRAQTIYQGPGTYSTYGNQTYGPGGTQSTYGNQTYTPGGTYSTYGNQTYGSDGNSYSTYGNTTYGSNGTTSQTYGNQTFINGPNGQSRTCSTYGNQTYCN